MNMFRQVIEDENTTNSLLTVIYWWYDLNVRIVPLYYLKGNHQYQKKYILYGYGGRGRGEG